MREGAALCAVTLVEGKKKRKERLRKRTLGSEMRSLSDLRLGLGQYQTSLARYSQPLTTKAALVRFGSEADINRRAPSHDVCLLIGSPPEPDAWTLAVRTRFFGGLYCQVITISEQ